MNERIRVLAEQSGLPTALDYHQKRYEKFAELIVTECAGIVQPYMSRWEEDCDLVIKIKQHFGVEE